MAQAAQDLDLERVQKGRVVYVQQCAGCHGLQGQGGTGPALRDRTLLANTPEGVLFSVIRSGIPNRLMPTWGVEYGGPLTDEDIRSVVSFIRQWEKNATVVTAEPFVPSPERGALIYAAACEICHGVDGAGADETRAINDPFWLQAQSDERIQSIMRFGYPEKGMPAWGDVLSPDQRADLGALFTAWRKGERVQAVNNRAELLAGAIFSLENGDEQSARVRIERAVYGVPSAVGQILEKILLDLRAGNSQSALDALRTLQADWPVGDAGLGASLFVQHCKTCHGVDGEGGLGKQLQPNEFVQENTNAKLAEFFRTGRAGTAMVSFSNRLKEDEIGNLIAFLRTWQK